MMEARARWGKRLAGLIPKAMPLGHPHDEGRAGFLEELKASCQSYVRPGERLRQVIGAQVGFSPGERLNVMVLGWLALPSGKHRRVLCVTDRTIVVLNADRNWMPKHVTTVLPRNIEFGPAFSGHKWSSIAGLGDGLYAHRMFYDQMEAADTDLRSGNL